ENAVFCPSLFSPSDPPFPSLQRAKNTPLPGRNLGFHVFDPKGFIGDDRHLWRRRARIFSLLFPVRQVISRWGLCLGGEAAAGAQAVMRPDQRLAVDVLLEDALAQH